MKNYSRQVDISEEVVGPENDFEPHNHGNNVNPISFYGAVIHILKFTIGYGILIVPYVFKNLDYVVAIALTLFTAVLYYHIIHIMTDVEYELCKMIRKPKLTFFEVINVGFDHVTPPLRIVFGSVIKLLMHLSFFIPTGNTIGLILMANMLKNMLEYWSVEMDFLPAVTAVFVPSMLMSVLVLRLDFMVPLSALTNFFTLIIMGILIIFPFFSDESAPEAHSTADVIQLPQCFSLLVDTFDATSVFLTVKNEMRTPKQFAKPLGVLNVSALIAFLLFTCFGFVGYWNYGEEVEANILDNVPADNILSFLVNVLFLPAVAVHNYLCTYVRCDVYRESVLKRMVGVRKRQNEEAGANKITLAVEYALRIFFNVFSYVLAVCVPSFSVFATITGTIGILVDIAIIPLLQLCLMVTLWSGSNKFDIFVRGIKNVLIVLMAFVLFLSSASSCVKALFKLYRGE